jgi:integrase
MRLSVLFPEVMAQREREGIRGYDREVSRWRCHIMTASFYEKDVVEIGSPDIREWRRAMAQKNAAGPGEPRKLSKHTINRCQSLLSAVFVDAVEREIRTDNPCTGVKGKRVADETDTKEKWAYLTKEEQDAVAACEGIPLADRLAIRFAIETGLRQGEQCNLELTDLVVDGDDPHVLVRYGSRSKAGKKLPPKSGKKRKVPLTPRGVRVAREWLALLPTFAPENPEGLVFPSVHGRRRHQGKPLGKTGTLKAHLALAGITRRVRWHDLRHTCATNLITGVLGRQWTLAEVQRVMGHSSASVTERYAHMSEDVIAKAARETVEAPAPSLQAEGPELITKHVERVGVLARIARRVTFGVRRVAEMARAA